MQMEDPMRILAINFGGIGDEILFLPTLQTIRSAFPQASITLLLEPRSRSVEQLTSLLDHVITFDIKKRPLLLGDMLELLMLIKAGGYDLVVSSGGSPLVAALLFLSGIRRRVGYGTSKLSRALLTAPVTLNKNQYAACMYHDLAIGVLRQQGQAAGSLGQDGPANGLLGQQNLNQAKANALNNGSTNGEHQQIFADRIPRVELKEESIDRMKGFLSSLPVSGSKRVLLHPGTSRLATEKGILKTWPTENWLNLLDLVDSFNADAEGNRIMVILAGGPDDANIIEEILNRRQAKSSPYLVSAFGKTKNIADLAALTHLCDLLVCVDSAPMHVGIGVRQKTVALFGPTNPALLMPDEPIFHPIWDKRDGKRHMFDRLGVDIAPATVFEAIKKLVLL